VIVKAAATARPEVFRDTFQQCLLDGVFPKRWKKMKLVLLPKGKGRKCITQLPTVVSVGHCWQAL